MPGDWWAAYRAQPLLLETLVDGSKRLVNGLAITIQALASFA
jgi:hypothetical protein